MYLESLSPVQKVDFAFYLIFGFSAVMLLGLTCTAAYFVWRYRASRHPRAEDIRGNIVAEVIWTLIPSLMVLGLFHYGWVGFRALRDAPADAIPVTVTARMWSWSFTYPNGKHSNVLVAPADRPVKLIMTSRDVIHSFFAPAFRIKMDTVPGMQTYAWFKAARAGDYDVFCAEYCGDKHADMLATIRVVDEAEYATWLNRPEEAAGAEAGKQLMDAQGCFACHSVDGGPGVGPTFKGAWNHAVTVHESGVKKRIRADDAYMRESVTHPEKKIADGYDNTMPPYPDLTKNQLDSMMEFLRSLAESGGNGAAAENAPPAGGPSPDAAGTPSAETAPRTAPENAPARETESPAKAAPGTPPTQAGKP